MPALQGKGGLGGRRERIPRPVPETSWASRRTVFALKGDAALISLGYRRSGVSPAGKVS